MDEITSLFKKLPSIATPAEISDDDELELLDFFVAKIIIQKLATQKKWKRQEEFFFSSDNKVIENMRPTQGASRHHVLRWFLQVFKVAEVFV